MTERPIYVLERVFDAPRDLVWKSWTDPKLLAHWYGPNVETIIHRLDVRPGGLWLNEMKWGDKSNFQRTEYREVDPPERLVMLQANADAQWEVAANPKMPDWPRTLLTTVTFEEIEGGTMMRLTWEPYEASEAEIACFAGALADLDKGWSAGMELLTELLSRLMDDIGE